MDIDKTASECEGHIRKAIANAYQAGVEDACAGIIRAILALYHKSAGGSPEELALLQAMKIAEEWTP